MLAGLPIVVSQSAVAVTLRMDVSGRVGSDRIPIPTADAHGRGRPNRSTKMARNRFLGRGREGFTYQGPHWSPPTVSCVLIFLGGTYGFSAYLRAKNIILRATIRVFGLI